MTLEGYSCQRHDYKFLTRIEVLSGGNEKFCLLEYSRIVNSQCTFFFVRKKFVNTKEA
jgi:hypothetical protein